MLPAALLPSLLLASGALATGNAAEVVTPARPWAGVAIVSTSYARFTGSPRAQALGLEMGGRLVLPARWSAFAVMPLAAASLRNPTPNLVGLGNLTAGVQKAATWGGFDVAGHASASAPTATRYGDFGLAARTVAVSQVLRDPSLYQPDTAAVRAGAEAQRTWGLVTAGVGLEARQVLGLRATPHRSQVRGALFARVAWTERLSSGATISATRLWRGTDDEAVPQAVHGAEAWTTFAWARHAVSVVAQLPLDAESRRVGVYGFGAQVARTFR